MPRLGELTMLFVDTIVTRGRALSARYGRAGWGVADQAIVSASNFLSLLLLARFLAPVEFGAFALAHTGLLLITSMQTSLLTQPHNVLGARLQGQAYRRFTGALVLAQLFMGVLLSVVLVLVGWALRYRTDVAFGNIVLALAGAALPWMLQEFVRRVLYTTSDTFRATMNDLVCYGLQLAGVASLAFAGRLSAVTGLVVFGTSSLVAALFGVWQLHREIEFDRRTSLGAQLREAWTQVWNFGRWLLAQNITVWFGANGHVWVVSALLSVEAVGLYRAAIQLVNVINPLRQAAFAYLPARGSIAFSVGGNSGLSRWVRRVAPSVMLPLVPLMLALVVFPEQVLALVYGNKFAGMGLGPILALAALAQAISFARYPMEVAVLATGASRSLFVIQLLPVALLMTLGVALIVSFGLIGVPLSMLSIAVVLFIATYLVYRQHLSTPPAVALQRG